MFLINRFRVKSSWHLSKTGAFIDNFIHVFFYSAKRQKNPPSTLINVVCSGRRAWGWKTRHWFLEGGGGVTLWEGISMSTVEKGAILQKCLNTLSLIVACEDRRHFATLTGFPAKKHLRNDHRNSILMICHSPRLRVVPYFFSGIIKQAKRERAWKSPHARKATRVGWFSRALAFRSLYYPWGKMGDYS